MVENGRNIHWLEYFLEKKNNQNLISIHDFFRTVFATIIFLECPVFQIFMKICAFLLPYASLNLLSRGMLNIYFLTRPGIQFKKSLDIISSWQLVNVCFRLILVYKIPQRF